MADAVYFINAKFVIILDTWATFLQKSIPKVQEKAK